VGSRADELIIFLIQLNLPAALGLGVNTTSNRNEYQKQKSNVSERGRPVRKADNLTAICVPIV
jgi:hypothetical protein